MTAITEETAPAVQGHWMDRDSQYVLHYQPNSADLAGSEQPEAPMQGHACLNIDDDTQYLVINNPPKGPVGRPPTAEEAAHPQPVVLFGTEADQNNAALLTATLWHAICRSGGPRPMLVAHAHCARTFDPDYLGSLPLPNRVTMPDGQIVTLRGHAAHDRHEADEARAEYERQPRTWIFEGVQRAVPWVSLVAAYLGELSGSRLEVAAGLFDSRSCDEAAPMHTDDWYSVILQVSGVKEWTIDGEKVTTRAGDVLLVPEGLPHRAVTPEEPGHSRHLVWGLCRHTIYTREDAALLS